ncbi:MAG: hypothetical protein KDA99_07290 [Planctomycetales bacterium]|nr:hypothetical protein [Planctomycetales bacterium]
MQLQNVAMMFGLLTCWFAVAIPYLVLFPVLKIERENPIPTKFRMTDFLWLIVILQVGMVPIVQSVPQQGMEGVRGVVVLVVLLAGSALWWGTVRVLCRAGVIGTWKRGVFQLVVVPATLVLTVGGFIVMGLLPLALATPVMLIAYGHVDDSLWLSAGCVILAIVLGAMLAFGMRQLTLWILADRQTADQSGPCELP